jgi:DNA invertase Pin-like site-specific DNA recombinase
VRTIALYARVSTRKDSQNTETQLMPLREFAQSRGFSIFQEYVDVGWSGAKERRPQLDRMMADAKKKRFEAVVVWRFDRFARSTKHLITALGEFGSMGIDFISMSESIDTSTPMGRLVFTILGAVAEMERELIRERVQAGVDRAKKQGKKLGRPRVLVDEQRILDLIKGGSSVRAAAKAVGVGRRTVDRIVERHAQ